MPSRREPLHDGVHVDAREPQRELAHDRLLVQRLDAVERARASRARRRCAAAAARPARRAPAGRASRGRRRRRARSAPARCRCSRSPSRGGCAARASAASARSRACRRRRRVSPAIRPGIRRRCSCAAAKKPNDGPPKSSRLPSVCPSPTAMSTPCAPGGSRIPSGIGSQAQMTIAPTRFAASVSAATSSTAPRKFGCCSTTAETSSPERGGRARRGRSRRPSAAPPRPSARSRARASSSVSRRVRVHAARGEHARAAVRQLREVGGRADRARALVDRRVRDRQARSAR